MELYERVKSVAKTCAGSDKALAEQLGILQSTFSQYLKSARQDNLWPILPRILEIYPQISREWLYFNEGSMIGESHTLSVETESPLAAALAEIVRLNQENRELRAKLDKMEGR